LRIYLFIIFTYIINIIKPFGLFINLDAEADESKTDNKTVLDMISDINNTKIRELFLTVNKNIHLNDGKPFIQTVLENGVLISKHTSRQFISSQSPPIFGNLYVYRYDNQIIKITNCDCDQPMAEFDIVREIAMQQYAYTIKDKCGFKVPNIINYGKEVISDNQNFRYNCFYYFTMDNITAKTLREYIETIDLDTTCTPLVKKINDIYKCMIDNDLYHNDYHQENIMIDANNDINVIDYGLATHKLTSIEENENPYDCAKLKASKLKASKLKASKLKSKAGSLIKRRRTKKDYRKNKNSKKSRKSNKKRKI